MYIFFYQTSHIFSRFLVISWYDFIIFLFYYHFYNEIHIYGIYSVKVYTEPSDLLFWELNL